MRPALAQAGLAAASVIYAQPGDDTALLAVVEDAVCNGTPAAVVAEASRVSMVTTSGLGVHVGAAAPMHARWSRISIYGLPRRQPMPSSSTVWRCWPFGAVRRSPITAATPNDGLWLDLAFRQLEGFGSYGFPASHAASFAKISYASSWMKHHHPDAFRASLLNA